MKKMDLWCTALNILNSKGEEILNDWVFLVQRVLIRAANSALDNVFISVFLAKQRLKIAFKRKDAISVFVLPGSAVR